MGNMSDIYQFEKISDMLLDLGYYAMSFSGNTYVSLSPLKEL